MKTMNKLLYFTIMTLGFISFVACSDSGGGASTPLDNGMMCSSCPNGYGNALGVHAIGKNFADTGNGAERFRIALSFFGTANSYWETYPLQTQVAAHGHVMVSQPIACQTPGLMIPAGYQAPVQTIVPGTLSWHHTIDGMQLTAGNLQIRLSGAGITAIPFGASVDWDGRTYGHGISTLSSPVEVYYNGYPCGIFGLSGYQ